MMRGKKHSKLHKNKMQKKKIMIAKKCKKLSNCQNAKNCYFPKKLPNIAAVIFRMDRLGSSAFTDRCLIGESED